MVYDEHEWEVVPCELCGVGHKVKKPKFLEKKKINGLKGARRTSQSLADGEGETVRP